MGGWCSSFWVDVAKPWFTDNILAVELPREIVITNMRLGFLYKILQGLMFVGLLSYVMVEQIWSVRSELRPYSITIWPETLKPEDIEAAQTQRHCTDPTSMAGVWAGAYEYRPTSCESMRFANGWVREVNKLMVFSQVLDWDTVQQVGNSSDGITGGGCGSIQREECTFRNGTFEIIEPNRCKCERTKTYFVAGAEKTTLHLYHGFELTTAEGNDVRAFTPAGAGNTKVLTKITDINGEPCAINGKSEYPSEEVQDLGIWGTLEEFMACAGMTMDQEPSTFSNGASSYAQLRTMGFRLVLHLFYTNAGGGDTALCTLTPRISPGWTSVYSRTTSYNDATLRDSYHTRARVAHGALVEIQVEGNMRYFGLSRFVGGVVNVVLLFSVPKMVMQFICIYCLGSVSRIYRSAKRTRFNIQEQVRTAVARSLSPLVTFRGLVGGDFLTPAEELPELSAIELKNHIEDIFQDELISGRMDEKHVNRMVMMVCEIEPGNFKDSISYRDFNTIINHNDVINSPMLVGMLHWRRKKWFLERIMDDTDRSLDDQVFPCLVAPTEPKTELQVEVRQSHADEERIAAASRTVQQLEKEMDAAEATAESAHRQVDDVLQKSLLTQDKASTAEAVIKQQSDLRSRSDRFATMRAQRLSRQHADENRLSRMEQLQERLRGAEATLKDALERAQTVSFRAEVLSNGVGQEATPK